MFFGNRVALLVGLFGYYLIQLALLSSKQGNFMKSVEALMAIFVFIGAGAIVSDNVPENVVLIIDGCLVGLSIGWLCYEASEMSSSLSSVFFTVNAILVFVLSCLDIRTQQTRIVHNALAADLMQEFQAHGGISGSGTLLQPTITTTSQSNDEERDLENDYSFPSVRHHEQRSRVTNNHILGTSSSSSSSGTTTGTNYRKLHLHSMEDILDGFRVRLERLPISTNSNAPDDVSWDSFSYVEHRVDSSSCHIYTAYWNGRTVIIKLIKADRVTSPMAIAEFETEAHILSRIEHPNIIKLLGSGYHPRRFLILELLDGGTLSHSLGLRSLAHNRVVKKKFSYMETLLLAQSLASALDYLHNHWNEHVQIIHRDLKPDNIGWSADGTLKLFDFGLCACVRKQIDRRDQYKLTGNTGTLRYMAPEVALGRQYNNSVDTYSFAVIIWQVLKSRIPFREMGKKMYVQEVVLGGKRPPLDRRWPAGFSALLQRCWHDNKEMRPTFSEVLVDLNVLLQEARGIGAASLHMKVRHKIRYAKSYMSYALRGSAKYRPLLFLCLGGILVAGALLAKFGKNVETGAALLVVASAGLYLVLLSYVPAGCSIFHPRGMDNQQDERGNGQDRSQGNEGGVSLSVSSNGSSGVLTARSDRSLLHEQQQQPQRRESGAGDALTTLFGGADTSPSNQHQNHNHRSFLGNLFSRGGSRRRPPSVGLIGLERLPQTAADPFASTAVMPLHATSSTTTHHHPYYTNGEMKTTSVTAVPAAASALPSSLLQSSSSLSIRNQRRQPPSQPHPHHHQSSSTPLTSSSSSTSLYGRNHGNSSRIATHAHTTLTHGLAQGHLPVSLHEVKLSLPAFNPLSPHEPDDYDMEGGPPVHEVTL